MIPRPWKLSLIALPLVLVSHLAPGPGSRLAGAADLLPEVARQRAMLYRQLGVDRWHRGGQRGQGMKIMILDCGFKGYRDQLGETLPQHVETRSFRQDGTLEARDSYHGILCAEVVHALAPAAELILATWEPNQPDQFLKSIAWARQAGVRIVSCSVVMPSWSDGEGGGPVHEQLAKLLGPGTTEEDMLFFASAGNMVRRHWSGPYHIMKGWHVWQADRIDNPVRPWREEVSVEMYWPAGCRYRLQVREVESGMTVPSFASVQPDRCYAVARFLADPDKRYTARVQLVAGPARPFHLVTLGADLDYTTARGSIPFPGDGPHVLAVGAVDEQGCRISYSSCGPNSSQPKPDLAAPVPFPSGWRDEPFTGTSAAAPQAAALAALCWSRHPDWTAQQVRQSLCRWASDVGDPGHDIETGHGVIHLPRLD